MKKSDNDKIFDAVFPKDKTDVFEENGVVFMSYIPDGLKIEKPRNITITNKPHWEKKEFKTISKIIISDEPSNT